ncbi:MAG: PhnD/SsuA/transferrin family substrate-binding protein [Rhodocyclaceae bacterium]|nr:PhnD/SsuA/transferrin family substrate-binding protein [Rhodocyclaceae bacterium]
MAYAVPSVALRAAKVRVEEVLAGNQEGALAQLRARQVEAAAVNSRFLTQYAAQHGMPYREVFSSEGYAELPVIAHPRLPRGEIEAIQKALLAMKNDPKGRRHWRPAARPASSRPPNGTTTTPAPFTAASRNSPTCADSA